MPALVPGGATEEDWPVPPSSLTSTCGAIGLGGITAIESVSGLIQYKEKIICSDGFSPMTREEVRI
jgi:hypothetical protein